MDTKCTYITDTDTLCCQHLNCRDFENIFWFNANSLHVQNTVVFIDVQTFTGEIWIGRLWSWRIQMVWFFLSFPKEALILVRLCIFSLALILFLFPSCITVLSIVVLLQETGFLSKWKKEQECERAHLSLLSIGWSKWPPDLLGSVCCFRVVFTWSEQWQVLGSWRYHFFSFHSYTTSREHIRLYSYTFKALPHMLIFLIFFLSLIA